MLQNMKSNNSSGVTLVELAIVIVIIGFILSAVMYGQSTIERSKLISVIRDVNNFKSAIETFKFKYGEIPGDFTSATNYWTSCVNVTTNTCNGDGDRIIEVTGNENGRAWQHLGLAKVLDQHYPGGVISSSSVVGVDVPRSTIDGIGYGIMQQSRADATTFNIVISLGVPGGGGAGTDGMSNPALKATDAWFIDRKIDDGVAASGFVFAKPGLDGANLDLAAHCLGGTDPSGYDVDDETNLCVLHFAVEL